MTAHLMQGDARRLPLADKSVQMVCTSPPFYGLRSYNTKLVIWGGDPDCPHALEDGPSAKTLTGGIGSASAKQVTDAGSQYGNAWATVHPPGYRSSDTNPGPLQNPGNTNRQRFGSAVCTRCGAWSGELGSEPEPALFVAHLVEVFAEVKRVLRDDGVCFLNIGDSYYANGTGQKSLAGGKPLGTSNAGGYTGYRTRAEMGATRPKSLLLVPERLAIALSDVGWIIRSRIAWCKAAPMPESVRDRPTSAWEHIWVLTKRGSYYWDAEAVRQDGAREYTYSPGWSGFNNRENYAAVAENKQPGSVNNGSGPPPTVQQGANLRNFWVLNPDPYPGAHFATFPREIPRRCILAATSEYGACAACGAPWRRVVERAGAGQRNTNFGSNGQQEHRPGANHTLATIPSTTTGWQPTCRCGPGVGVRPCIVLDPFSGSGTTAYVAASLGRVGVGVELSWDYLEQTRYGRLAQGFLPLAPAALSLEVGA